MTDFICIKTYNDRLTTELIKGLLEANGIKSIVSADDCGGYRPHLAFVGRVRLLVSKGDVQKALDVLEDSTKK